MDEGFRDEGGGFVLLGEGAQMQIHISIFLISVLGLRRRPFVLGCCHQSAQRGTYRTAALFVHSSCLATLSHPGGAAEHPARARRAKHPTHMMKRNRAEEMDVTEERQTDGQVRMSGER